MLCIKADSHEATSSLLTETGGRKPDVKHECSNYVARRRQIKAAGIKAAFFH